jgi:bifunctional DNA-binding transcriptional regulator/antitoxin component of YhaV-PrlF toxin-antitoxin module
MAEGGRVVVPVELRRQLGLAPGTPILFDVVDGSLRIRTLDEVIRAAQALVQNYVPQGRSLVYELIAERRAEAAREDEEWR